MYLVILLTFNEIVQILNSPSVNYYEKNPQITTRIIITVELHLLNN